MTTKAGSRPSLFLFFVLKTVVYGDRSEFVFAVRSSHDSSLRALQKRQKIR